MYNYLICAWHPLSIMVKLKNIISALQLLHTDLTPPHICACPGFPSRMSLFCKYSVS
jgi:hypothetical protein